MNWTAIGITLIICVSIVSIFALSIASEAKKKEGPRK